MLTEEHIKKELETGELFKLNIELPLKEKYLGMVYKKDNRKKRNYLRLLICIFWKNNCVENNITNRIYDLKIEKCYYIL